MPIDFSIGNSVTSLVFLELVCFGRMWAKLSSQCWVCSFWLVWYFNSPLLSQSWRKYFPIIPKLNSDATFQIKHLIWKWKFHIVDEEGKSCPKLLVPLMMILLNSEKGFWAEKKMGEITNEQKRKTFLEPERKNWNQIWRRKIRKKQSKCIFGSNNNDAFKHSHNQREERLESLAFSMLLHVAVKQSDCVDVNLFFSKKRCWRNFCVFFLWLQLKEERSCWLLLFFLRCLCRFKKEKFMQ